MWFCEPILTDSSTFYFRGGWAQIAYKKVGTLSLALRVLWQPLATQQP